MTIFDLLFGVLFLIGVTSLLVASGAALLQRRARALVILRRLSIVAALYVCVLILVSVLTPRRLLALGEDQCSDDWCIAVQAVRRDTTRGDVGYEVAFRLSSRARGVAQRERFVAVYLRDERGHRYGPVAAASAVPFDTLLSPGQAIVAVRRFMVPARAGAVGLVVAREGGGWFPGCCIIGDEGSLFHRRAIVKLD